MKNWIKENKSDIIVFIIYIAVSFSLIFFHEAWRDEAQAWLLARDLNFTELIAQMKYEGHFLLWYLILMPFAKMGFPYITTNIISWLITAVSVWLILKYAPFKKYKKYLFIFSFPMLYLFPIVSRSYCLIPLAISLIAIFYKERKTKPIRYVLSIVLLFNTHIVMAGMVGILLLEFFIELFKNRKNSEKKYYIGCVVLTILLLILSTIPLLGALTTNKDIGNEESLVEKLLNMFIIAPCTTITKIYGNCYTNIVMFDIVIALAMLYLFFEIMNHKREFAKISLIFLWQYAIYAFIYGISEQRASTGILILFFYRWIRAYEPKEQNLKIDKKITDIIVIILLFINILEGIIFIRLELSNNYSSAYQVGEYINENIDETSVIITGGRTEFCTAIIPYVSKDIKFYNIKEDKYFTHSVWNEKNKEILQTDFTEQLLTRFVPKEDLYYIYSLNTFSAVKDEKIVKQMEEKNKLIKVFETDKDFYAQETYIVYKINLTN